MAEQPNELRRAFIAIYEAGVKGCSRDLARAIAQNAELVEAARHRTELKATQQRLDQLLEAVRNHRNAFDALEGPLNTDSPHGRLYDLAEEIEKERKS